MKTPQMLNLNDVYFFVQVVDQKGFTAAARALDIPRSTLSKRVAALEKHLGVRLIQRTTRSFTVTEVGQDFYRHASAMLIDAEAAENVVKGRLAEPSGTVRISVSVPMVQFSLADMLPELALAYPKIQVVLQATDRFVDLVQEGFDIAVRNHFAPLPASGLVQRRVGFDPNFLLASPEYLDRCGVPRRPGEIARHDGILNTAMGQLSWSLQDRNGTREEVRSIPRLLADESLTLIKAATAGVGIMCLPSRRCQPQLKDGSLVRVLPEWSAGGITTTLLMPHRRGQLPSVRTVADFLIARLSTRSSAG